MKLLTAAFFFIFVSTIELRVRATEVPANDKVVETPENCVKDASSYCIIKNLGKKFTVKMDSYFLSLSPDSILVRQKLKEFSFVKGQVFVKTDVNLIFEVPYGQIEVEKSSQVILEKVSDKVSVQTIFGKVFLKPLGEKKPIVVMAGQENFLAQVGENQKAQTGIPKPIMIEPLLKAWSFHANVKKQDFLDEVESFKSVHEKAVQDLSILNEQIATREIASVKAEKKAREDRLRRAQQEKKARQESYIQRLLNE